MGQFQPIQMRYNSSKGYPGTQQNNSVGAQMTAGQRGTLPAAVVPSTYDNSQAYYISKTGSDTNSGTSAAPFLTLGSIFNTSLSSTTDTSGLNGASQNSLTINGTGIAGYQWPYIPIASIGSQA